MTAGSLVLFQAAAVAPALAQLQVPGFAAPTSGGLFGSSPTVLIGEASKSLVAYCEKHGHLPQSSAEIDEALKTVHAKLNGGDSSSQPASEKQYRVLGNVMIAQDPSLKGASLADIRKNPPEAFKAPEGRVVVLITTADEFIIWYSAADGKPAVDALGQAIILHEQCSK